VPTESIEYRSLSQALGFVKNTSFKTGLRTPAYKSTRRGRRAKTDNHRRRQTGTRKISTGDIGRTLHLCLFLLLPGRNTTLPIALELESSHTFLTSVPQTSPISSIPPSPPSWVSPPSRQRSLLRREGKGRRPCRASDRMPRSLETKVT